jgi:hypothetical protein
MVVGMRPHLPLGQTVPERWLEEDLSTMTADVCLAYCKSASYTFAGIEYTRYGTPLVLAFESQMLGNTSIAGFSTDSRQGMLLRQFAQRHF